jgi:hypothetical protein
MFASPQNISKEKREVNPCRYKKTKDKVKLKNHNCMNSIFKME